MTPKWTEWLRPGSVGAIKEFLVQPFHSVSLSADLLCCTSQRCSSPMPICECSTRKQPHTNFGLMLKGNSSVKTESMSLEMLCVCSPLLLTAGTCARGVPHSAEQPAAELQGGQVQGPSSETIPLAFQLGLISLILSSAACWNQREQSTFSFCFMLMRHGVLITNIHPRGRQITSPAPF